MIGRFGWSRMTYRDVRIYGRSEREKQDPTNTILLFRRQWFQFQFEGKRWLEIGFPGPFNLFDAVAGLLKYASTASTPSNTKFLD